MNKNILLVFAITLTLVGAISAAGISSPYWKEHPLYMDYGETKVVNFNLQNMVGSEDIMVEVMLKQGSNIATLEKTTYTAKAQTHDTMIPLTITIPEDYNGGVQLIELEVKTINQDDSGMVVLGTGWISSFNVIVEEKPVSSTSLVGVIIALIAVIIVAVIIILVLVKKRK